MTREEQINCTFEPKVAALNSMGTQKDAEINSIIDRPVDHNSYAKRHGENLELTHPEIRK